MRAGKAHARSDASPVVPPAVGSSVRQTDPTLRPEPPSTLVACAMEAQKVDLRLRMSEIGSVLDRLRAGTDFAVDSALSNANERSVRVNAWQVADDSPDLRQILRERRGEMVGFARMVLQEAVDGGELPGWIDVDSIASAFLSLIDGFLVRALEMGELSVEEARRDAYSLLELLVAAPHDRPASVDALRSEREPSLA